MSIGPDACRRAWLGVAWFGVAFLLYLSLTPSPPEIPVAEGDKLGHSAAYLVLTYWWMQLYVVHRQRRTIAASLLALGIAIEFVQGWTGWRSFDVYDMLADLVGISLGWLLATPRLPNLLALTQRVFSRA